MKLKYTGIVEAEPCENRPGEWEITKGTALVPLGWVIRIEYIKANFTPADNESLNTLDPDRTERLCPPGIG